MQPGARLTIKQVAAAAGVSTQTISRVVNGKPDVAAETRAHVQQVIDRLGYRPNAVARSLIGRRTYTLGVVAGGIEYFGPSGTLTGIERQAAEYGYSVLLSLLHDQGNGEVEKLLADLLSRQVEGIIWAVPEIGDNHRWIRQMPRLQVPVLFLTMQPQSDLPVVALDNRTGSRIATEHLLAQGRRNIGLITGPLSWWEAQQRRLGWQDALEAAGIAADMRRLAEGNWSAASGESAFLDLHSRFPQMDALVAGNDQMAAGVLHAIWSKGLRVPDDIALVGFDDIPEAAYFIPPLTTVRQETNRLGVVAVQVLRRLIESNNSEGRIASIESVWLQPELVVRESSVSR